MLGVINLILGGALLVAGRKLFWLFVGAAGFVTGIQLATRFWHGSDVLAIIVGLVFGAIFALLAIFLQAALIGIAGFLSGGYILTALATMLGMEVTGITTWIVYVIGGILGLVLVTLLLDWALITLSSLAGAALIVQGLFPQGATGDCYLSFSSWRASSFRDSACAAKKRLLLPPNNLQIPIQKASFKSPARDRRFCLLSRATNFCMKGCFFYKVE